MTIDDLRGMLDEQSLDGPDNDHRLSQIRRRIRHSARRRLVGGAAVAAAVMVAAAGTLSLPGVEVVSSPPSASSTTVVVPEPPEVFAGMERTAYRRSTAANTLLQLDVTGHGPHAAIVVTCPPGFELLWRAWFAGGMNTRCDPHDGNPGAVVMMTGEDWAMPGQPRRVDVAVVPSGTAKAAGAVHVGTSSPPQQNGTRPRAITLEELLARQQPVQAGWAVAVYSGTCAGDARCE
ncbi:hypothetical protein [Nonomuraea zeae]|uniref:Uncharacterized protein n=1 Tax=Nonomuraea zeae TaxID=1642303 RepID=A0A5S4HAH5_9ACTN|nr:hypothetical protein [Nonomuraea zeae]TMR35870.1 hypothetical protein ETD85_12375 [Nonomuraea zeae]